MFWRFLPHASACVTSDMLVLLDLRQDRYFQVPRDASSSMLGWLQLRHACAPPSEVRSMLMRARIIRGGDAAPTNALKQRISIPDALVDLETRAETLARPIRVARAVAATWLRLRFFPFYSVIHSRMTRTPLPVLTEATAARWEAAIFERSRCVVPIARNCLLDSLALDGWLAHRGLGSHLIFGVASRPFAAHCWLQTGDAILNDSYDNVSRFTPILAL